MKTWIVYYTNIYIQEAASELQAEDIEQAVDLFFNSYGPVSAISAVIEKKEALK